MNRKGGKWPLAILCALCLCVPSWGHADRALVTQQPRQENLWLKNKAEGWFFYNEEEEPPEEESPPPPVMPPVAVPVSPPVEPPAQPAVAPKKAKPLTVEWFHDHYQEVLNRAVDNPTPENVQAYLFLQRVILDKSTNFAYAVRNAVYSEPLLDENTRIPLASAMRAAMLDVRDKNVKAAFRFLGTKAGLWFFVHSQCQFCAWQLPHVKAFSEKYGVKLMAISQDGQTIPGLDGITVLPDMGQSQRLGIRVVPSLALVVPEREEIIVFSQGLLSYEGIEHRLLTIMLERHLLPKDMADNIDIFRRGILTPSQINNVPQEDDPVKLIHYIRNELRKNWTGGDS